MTHTDVPLLYPSEPRSIQLANTLWATQGQLHDSLESAASLRRWASAAGVRGHASLTNVDLVEARELRDAIRRLAAETTGDHRPMAVDDSAGIDDSLAILNRFLRSQSLALARADDGTLSISWTAAVRDFRGALIEIATEAAHLLTDGGSEIRACLGPGCVLYFARQGGRREWCSPGCGNRARVARHYRRHKPAN